MATNNGKEALMYAVVCLSDGDVGDLAVFNSREEAVTFKNMNVEAIGVVYDRISICPVTPAVELQNSITDDFKNATEEETTNG